MSRYFEIVEDWHDLLLRLSLHDLKLVSPLMDVIILNDVRSSVVHAAIVQLQLLLNIKLYYAGFPLYNFIL